MIKRVELEELNCRMVNFRRKMDELNQDWELTVVFSKINLFYFTGTMQEGMLLIPRDDQAVFFARRSYERAVEESNFPIIKPMNSYLDAVGTIEKLPSHIYMETEFVPLAMYQRFLKHFPFEGVKSADKVISTVRAVKSKYELSLIYQSGEVHRRILEERVPKLLKAGISEAELAGELYLMMLQEGHHGVARVGMFDTDLIIGHICFGESSIYPTYFNGPGGHYGMSPAVPLIGSRERKLKKGDLVFIDIACGVDGYHTDKTMTYMFGESLPEDAIDIHYQCLQIQNDIAVMLKPGAIPSHIYRTTLEGLSPEFLENFMGYENKRVKFLGHGTGLVVDEYPVIAEGFDEPLQEGMVIALEPKKGLKGIGMVGVENTFLVTREGGKCITGDHPGLILIPTVDK